MCPLLIFFYLYIAIIIFIIIIIIIYYYIAIIIIVIIFIIIIIIIIVSLLLYLLLYILQFRTKLNPSALIFDSPKVTFESHDLHFIILLKVNSDANSIILYPRIYYYTTK